MVGDVYYRPSKSICHWNEGRKLEISIAGLTLWVSFLAGFMLAVFDFKAHSSFHCWDLKEWNGRGEGGSRGRGYIHICINIHHEDEMVGWHHWLNRHEFEQTLGDNEEQGSLVHCSRPKSRTWLNNRPTNDWFVLLYLWHDKVIILWLK